VIAARRLDDRTVVCECGCGSVIFDLTVDQYERERRLGCIVVLPGHIHGRAVVSRRRGFAVVALGLLSDTGPAAACPPGPVSLSRPDVVDLDETGSALESVGDGSGAAHPAAATSRASGCSSRASTTTGGTTSGHGARAAAVAPAGREPEPGSALRHLPPRLRLVALEDRDEAVVQTSAFLRAPHTFK